MDDLGWFEHLLKQGSPSRCNENHERPRETPLYSFIYKSFCISYPSRLGSSPVDDSTRRAMSSDRMCGDFSFEVCSCCLHELAPMAEGRHRHQQSGRKRVAQKCCSLTGGVEGGTGLSMQPSPAWQCHHLPPLSDPHPSCLDGLSSLRTQPAPPLALRNLATVK